MGTTLRARTGGQLPSQDWDPFSSACPSREMLNRLADKWALLILALLSSGPLRFNALRRRIDGVSQKMLSQTLKNLERDGLISRTVYPTVPVTCEYALTDLGQTLRQTIDALRAWTVSNMDRVLQAQQSYDAERGPR